MPTAKQPVTTPAHKYGPTHSYGECEAAECRATARVTCETCKAHLCHTHAQHEAHADD